MLPNNTASAHKANEPSFVDRSPNESGEDDCLRIQALPRAIERGKCSTGYKEETREQRQKQMLEIAAAAPTPYTWKALQSTAQCPTHTHRASMQTYSLPLPAHPPPNTCSTIEEGTDPRCS